MPPGRLEPAAHRAPVATRESVARQRRRRDTHACCSAHARRGATLAAHQRPRGTSKWWSSPPSSPQALVSVQRAACTAERTPCGGKSAQASRLALPVLCPPLCSTTVHARLDWPAPPPSRCSHAAPDLSVLSPASKTGPPAGRRRQPHLAPSRRLRVTFRFRRGGAAFASGASTPQSTFVLELIFRTLHGPWPMAAWRIHQKGELVRTVRAAESVGDNTWRSTLDSTVLHKPCRAAPSPY
ncbi:hypothetical protein T440DRAFT_526722 [Plenodomus tracheiphilus IPT5]|uniref:Uncharacterized protein n=1 Tax=Plenodomus tracheiphilus IPT5 TaxID=1408161 RepID=A0A6A7BAF4_9PLEO|nr:hypothetical protein T440DRAFT_526722 [Plenodomus tracheiphilus IPT5]